MSRVGETRNEQEKSGTLIWNLETHVRRLDPNEIRKKTGLQECDDSHFHRFLEKKASKAEAMQWLNPDVLPVASWTNPVQTYRGGK